jgi:putative pyruvate formate lyase activating enzyme
MKNKGKNIINRRRFIKGMLMAVGGISYLSVLNIKHIKARTNIQPSMEAKKGFEPAYLTLHRNGELKNRYLTLREMMADCKLCPRECRVNRLKGEEGVCGSSSTLKISSFHPHFGEESPLVGNSGSGTIFFTHCGLLCVFCINADISHGGHGNVRTVNDLAQMMMTLQKMGCQNINVVTPTHYSSHILEALYIAAKQGLRLPVAYNTHGWERMEILKILDGVIDIYLSDFKYTKSSMAGKYSAGAYSYPAITKEALI